MTDWAQIKKQKKKESTTKKSLAAISTQELLSNATHQGEACSEASASRAVFLYKGVPGVALQPIGLRLSPSNQKCAAN